jgi:hypothetical protein
LIIGCIFGCSVIFILLLRGWEGNPMKSKGFIFADEEF